MKRKRHKRIIAVLVSVITILATGIPTLAHDTAEVQQLGLEGQHLEEQFAQISPESYSEKKILQIGDPCLDAQAITPAIVDLPPALSKESALEEEVVLPEGEEFAPVHESLLSTMEEPSQPLDPALPEELGACELDVPGEIISFVEVDSSSVIVYSFAELKSLLSQSNGYTTFYLGADIVGTVGGIVIHPSKASVVIDGHAPGAPAGDRRTITDYATATFTDTIRVDTGNATTKAVTLQNLVIAGRNYYGTVSVNDAVRDVVMTYINVSYTGPQLTYNTNGTGRYIDSTVSIVTATSAANELGEMNRAEFGGTFTFETTATGYSCIWIYGNGSINILEGADVTFTTPAYFAYLPGTDVSFTAKAGSKFTLNQNTGTTYTTQVFSNFTVEPGARASIRHNGTSAYGALRVSKALTVKDLGSLEIIRSTTGTALQMTATAASVFFDNPYRVFLYSPSSSAATFTGTNSFKVNATAVNLWANTSWPPTGILTNRPSQLWNKQGSGMLLDLTVNYNGNTIQSLTSNLTGDDFQFNPLIAANFNLQQTRLFSAGYLPIEIAPIFSGAKFVQGSTESGAELKVDYYSGSVLGSAGGTAAGDGSYEVLVEAVDAGSPLTVSAVAAYLMRMEKTVVLEKEAILGFLDVPLEMQFETTTLAKEEVLIPRLNTDWRIQVLDTRPSAGTWSLGVSTTGPLTAQTPQGPHVLQGALVYVDGQGSKSELNESDRIVYTTQSGQEITDISWAPEEGIMISLRAGGAYADTTYHTTLNWTLFDTP